MTSVATVFAGGTRVAGRPDSVSQHREDWRMARAVHADLLLMGMPRVNLMLTGPAGVIQNVLDTLLVDLHEPVARWSPGKRLVLPQSARTGTMILENVGALPLDDQLRVLEWLEEAVGQTQVVCTTSGPLYPHVRAGGFLERLYYRLNTLYVDVTA